jgi:hypothetical protein
MLKSPLKPELISRSKGTSVDAALKFISGGALLGSSISSLAANKIVGFNRAKVVSKKSGIQNLIETISSNIFNNNNLISNIFGGTNNQTTTDRGGLFSFASGAFDKIKEALAFVSFFGAKKNLDAVRNNIKILKTIFEETFDIAKELRKAINKIFKELTGINASGGGGGGGGGILAGITGLLGGLLGRFIPGLKGKGKGIVKAEGEGLTQAARNISKERGLFSKLGGMFKGGGKLALAATGLAGLGMAANAISGSGNEEVKPAEDQGPDIPGTILDKFNSILDRFDKVLDGLLKGGKGPSSGGSKGGSGTSGSSAGGGGGEVSPPTTTVPSAGQISGTQAETEKQMFSYLTSSVGLTNEQAAGILGNAMRESGYRTNAPEGGFQGMFQWDATRWARLNQWAKSAGLNPMDNGTQLQYALIEAKERGTLDQIKKAKTPEEAAKLFYNQFEVGAYANSLYSGSPHEKLNIQYAYDVLKRQRATRGPFVPQTQTQTPTQPTPGVQPAPAPATQPPAGIRSGTPSTQPAPSSSGKPTQPQQPNVAVINTGSNQPAPASAPSGGGTISMPSPAKNGPDVPFPSSNNPDNFLVFYSRLTYNIIDG